MNDHQECQHTGHQRLHRMRKEVASRVSLPIHLLIPLRCQDRISVRGKDELSSANVLQETDHKIKESAWVRRDLRVNVLLIMVVVHVFSTGLNDADLEYTFG